MRNLIIALLAALSFGATAQNFSCFQAGAKNYFINGNNYVRGIRIDSIATSGADTIYYPYRTWRISNYLPGAASTSAAIIGGSWLGGKVIKQADGTFLFDNLWDTVTIKTQAHTGDTWLFFNDTTNMNYTATVTEESTMSVLGIPDSIKKITITADSAGSIHAIDPVNNFQIILSKNHGFVQTFDLYTFPYHRPDTLTFDPFTSGYEYYVRWIDYYLDVVLNNLGTCDVSICADNLPDTTNSIFHLIPPLYIPTTAEIYNFSEGDVFESHYSEYFEVSGDNIDKVILDTVSTVATTAYTTSCGGPEHQRIATRYISGSTITLDTTYGNSGYSYYGDTSLLLPKMPEEYDGEFLLHYYPTSYPTGILCDTSATYVLDHDYKGNGFGSTDLNIVPSYSSKSYSVGYGMFNLSGFDATVLEEISQSYIYYQKGTSSCGSFLSCLRIGTGLNFLNKGGTVKVIPNPATDHISITSSTQFDNNTIVAVYDVSGKCILKLNADYIKNTMSLNTSSWPDGLYMVIVQDNSGIVKKEKVVVQH